MSIREVAPIERLEALPTAQGQPVGWWGVMLLCTTEAMLFALLLFTYFYLWTRATDWPLGGIPEPELLQSGIRSLLLWSSSATMHLADSGIRGNKRRRAVLGLLGTIVLAGVFLAGHAAEFVKAVSEYTWQTNAYGSLFYTITNFHAAHLAVGVAMITFTLVGVLRGRFDADRHLTVQNTTIYWHFVDIIWVVVFASLYLAPHLL